jgi:hypothetical protein
MFPDVGAGGVPAISDYGPLGLVGIPTNILGGYDPQFGDVYIGDGDGSGTTPVRGYRIPYNPNIDFGLGPTSFSVSFWCRNYGPPPAVDYYVFAFDTGTGTFPGYACSLDTSSQVSFNTANVNAANTTAKTIRSPFDGVWHHWMFTHIVGAAGDVTANQYNYVDGTLDSVYPACATVGSVSNQNSFYFGTDDDGATGQFGGLFFDFRIYNRPLWLPDSQAMYHQDTRWELYSPVRRSYVFMPPASVFGGYWGKTPGSLRTVDRPVTGPNLTRLYG